MNLRFTLLAAVLVALGVGCSKSDNPVISLPQPQPLPTNEVAYEPNTADAMSLARSQNYFTQLLTRAISASFNQPEFYGLPMSSSAVDCPTSTLSSDGSELMMLFGSDASAAGACVADAGQEIGGTIIIDRGNQPSLALTKECDPGYFRFSNLYLEGCQIQKTGVDPEFYQFENCPSVVFPPPTNQVVDFEMQVTGATYFDLTETATGDKTSIFPVQDEAFVRIGTLNDFAPSMTFDDFYYRNYEVEIPSDGSYFTAYYRYDENGNFQEAGKTITTDDLIINPGECRNIIDGTLVLLHPVNLMAVQIIDYGYGEPDPSTGESTDDGACDNWVQICYCKDGGAICNDCIVVNCLPEVQ